MRFFLIRQLRTSDVS